MLKKALLGAAIAAFAVAASAAAQDTYRIAAVNSVFLTAGDSVRINEGPFAGLQAIFEKKMKGSERVAVLLELLGRQTRLILPSETVTQI